MRPLWERPNNSPSDVVGLTYMRGRWYDPQAGRFIQEDPLGVDGSLNLYGFGGDDPVNGSDPSGMSAQISCYYIAHASSVDGVLDGGYYYEPVCEISGGDDSPGPTPTDGEPTGYTPGGVGGSSGPGPQPPKPPAKKCAKSGGSFGAGVGFGGTAEAGVAAAGVIATGGLGAGVFHNGGGPLSGYSAGGYASGAAAAYALGHSSGSPAQSGSTGNAGAFAGIGPSIFFTNAASVHQLEGPFNTIQVNIGGVYGSGGFQFAWGGGVWQLTISVPIPLASPGVGAAGSWVTTNTKTIAATSNACK